MEIIEVKQVRINGKDVFLPTNYWLNIKNGLVKKDIDIEIENFNINIRVGDKKNIVQICNQKDLLILLEKLDMPIVDFEKLRLKIIYTKKWGEKLIYAEGAKSICFSCYSFKEDKECCIMLFNTDGTKDVENIYIHGIWRSELE